MSITIKSNPDGVTGAIQVNGVDKVTIGASGITAGSFAPNSVDATAVALAFSGANQSLASSGYQKLPSGLIIQWGQRNIAGDTGTTSFNITFPNGVFHVGITDYGSSAGSSAAYSINDGTITTSQFTWYVSTLGQGGRFNWIALGY